MSGAQFTPGPWEIGERYGMLKTEVVAADHSRAIATVWTHKQPTVGNPREVEPDEAGTANAHLIAAAPELYEALLCASGSIDHALNCRARYSGECGCGQRALVDQIESVLAKARGETLLAEQEDAK